MNASTTYYIRIYGYGLGTYTLTLSKGGSEGSKENPVELTLGTAHAGTVEGYTSGSDHGNSYYKFTTSDADKYTLSMTNSDNLGCKLYSDSGFSSYVSSQYNNCYAGANFSKTFTGTSSSGSLSASTTNYLGIRQTSATSKTTTYNITVAKAN